MSNLDKYTKWVRYGGISIYPNGPIQPLFAFYVEIKGITHENVSVEKRQSKSLAGTNATTLLYIKRVALWAHGLVRNPASRQRGLL